MSNRIEFSKSDKAKIIRMFKDGRTCKEIGDAMFVNQITIRNRLREWDVYTKKSTMCYSREDRIKIAFEMYKGRKAKVIAAEYGISVDTVRNYYKELDVDKIPVIFIKPGDLILFEQSGQKFGVIEIMQDGKVVRSVVADGRQNKHCFIYGDLWIGNEPHRVRYSLDEIYANLTWEKIVSLQS